MGINSSDHIDNYVRVKRGEVHDPRSMVTVQSTLTAAGHALVFLSDQVKHGPELQHLFVVKEFERFVLDAGRVEHG